LGNLSVVITDWLSMMALWERHPVSRPPGPWGAAAWWCAGPAGLALAATTLKAAP